jgi:hypothetical protein
MYHYFKCNVLGGFRLSDLNRNIRQGDYFYVESSFCETSRAVKAALVNKWMTEVTEKEASQFISVPKQAKTAISQLAMTETLSRSVVNNVATPDVHETNQKLESRQTERSFRRQPMQKQKDEEKPVTPNFNQAEQAMRLRQADVCTKGPDEVLKSPVESKREKQEKVVTITQSECVKDLANEIADNSMLATPNFDERKTIKAELVEEIKKEASEEAPISEDVPVIDVTEASEEKSIIAEVVSEVKKEEVVEENKPVRRRRRIETVPTEAI